jgi:hypothetical protein
MISSEEDVQPSKWKCTGIQTTDVRRDVVQRLTTNHRHFVDNKKFTVCPTVVEMQSIHPLHRSHILISLITATEMTKKVYRASIDDIRCHARCRRFLISMIPPFYKFEILKLLPYFTYSKTCFLG